MTRVTITLVEEIVRRVATVTVEQVAPTRAPLSPPLLLQPRPEIEERREMPARGKKVAA